MNDGNGLRTSVEMATSMGILKNFFGVSKASCEDILRLFSNEVHSSEVGLKDGFWFTYVVAGDISELVTPRQCRGLCECFT